MVLRPSSLLLTLAMAAFGPAVAAQEAAPAAPAGPPIPETWAPVPTDEAGGSAYGLFLAGRNAMQNGEGGSGARYLAEAQALTPEQPTVRTQAFTAALLAGDLDVAAGLTDQLEGAPPALTQAGRLISVVRMVERGEAEAANRALIERPIGAPHARAGLLVGPWIAAAAGDWERALASPGAHVDPPTASLMRLNRAALLEGRRRHAEAEAELRSLGDLPTSGPMFRAPLGEFLERRGRVEEARALYSAAPEDPASQYALARLAGRGRPRPVPDARAGAALALTAAAAQASAGQQGEFAVVYLRLAAGLDPAPELRLRLGQTLAQAGLKTAAQRAFAEIPSTEPPIHAAAQAQLGLLLQEEGDAEGALAAFERARASAPDEPSLARLVAGQLVALERHEAALALLNAPVLNTAEQDFEIRFLRGAAYESLGRVPEAEAELWAALQARPNDPTALNYLGYLWVDSGARVAEGAEMIARAFAAEPDSGNIQDSLGWAQYRQGQYETAVTTLEEAVAKEPANAEINDHLGDAYWRVGRQREAGFQWRRVLSLETDAERRAAAERKLTEGLPAVEQD
jgi:tetratricopeptide (TPR) repeat protein